MITVDRKRYTNWLHFCRQNMPESREIVFDENGISGRRDVQYRDLPFDQSASWTYFETARDEGHLKDFAGNGKNYFRFGLSDLGLVFLQENHMTWWGVQWKRLVDNTITIVLAVLTAWALSLFGPKP